MDVRSRTMCLLAGIVVGAASAGARADEAEDITEGGKLYVAQCKICHGAAEKSHAGNAPFVRLAMQQPPAQDVPMPLIAEARAATHDPSAATAVPTERLAFAPPFGPNLQGVYGRPAGTAPGYEYSGTFLKALSGMEWNDAALDVWITNPQAWVPGVYMYYKQPNGEIRRKIIAYLKANR